MQYNDIRQFNISVADGVLTDLNKKLELTRLPDELDLPFDQSWDWGMPLAVLKPVLDYWRTTYDWRSVEKRINETLPQFTAHVESLSHGLQEIHFVHKRSDSETATPLLFIHGWPGSFMEVRSTSPCNILSALNIILILGIQNNRWTYQPNEPQGSRVSRCSPLVRL